MAPPTCLFSVLALGVVTAIQPVGPQGVDPVLDCGVRALAFEYAQYLQPLHDVGVVFDALRLGAECNETSPRTLVAVPAVPAPAASAFYVDAVNGNDGNAGSVSAPFATIARGLQATRSAGGAEQLVLRAGTFALPSAIMLGPADSGLTISAFPGEQPVISGGAPLSGLTWTKGAPGPQGGVSGPFPGVSVVSNTPGMSPGGNVSGVIQYAGSFSTVDGCVAACVVTENCASYTWHDGTVTGGYADQCYFRIDGSWSPTAGFPGHFSGAKVAGIDATVWSAPLPPGLTFANLYSAATGRRLTRAKSPNGNPEMTIDGFDGGATSWLPPRSYQAPTDVNIPSPSRADDPFFATYQNGLGGTCAIFEPSSGFWCSKNPPAGSQFNVPSGVVVSPRTFPGTWDDMVTAGAIFHAFHGDRWGDWKFLVSGADVTTGQLTWTYGGFQEARGSGNGDTFMLENFFAALDDYDEFFYDGGTLYVMVNNTAPAPSSGTAFIATQLDSLIRVEGTAAAPVSGVTLQGLTLSHTAPTFMLPYTMASGGDWSVRRDAALVLNGTSGVLVDACFFIGLGGNAALITGWNRGATISNSVFRFVGDNAVVSLGNVNVMDGTALDCPVGTIVKLNLISEIGLYTKQSGAYYHALSVNATVTGNIMFNMPRAGISE